MSKHCAQNARIPSLGYGALQEKDESQEAPSRRLCVLVTLRDNLFALSQDLWYPMSSLTNSFIKRMDFEEKERLVSSVYMLTSECLKENEDLLFK